MRRMTKNIPDMNDLRAELDQLTDDRLDYVIARSKAKTDADGYRNAGIPKGSFYTWAAEEREMLNALAQRVKRESALRALMLIQDAAEEAAMVKVEGLRSRKEHIKQATASEILDRIIGKSATKTQGKRRGYTERHEHTGADGGPIITVQWDDTSSD